MCNAGRHTPHRCQFFLATASLHVAHVFQKQHAQLFARLRFALACEPDAHTQRAQHPGVERQHHIAAGLRPDGLLEGALHCLDQCVPGGNTPQLKRRRPAHAVLRQQALRSRIYRTHAAVAVDNKHAVLHFLDHQAVQLRLLSGDLQAVPGGDLFSGQTTC